MDRRERVQKLLNRWDKFGGFKKIITFNSKTTIFNWINTNIWIRFDRAANKAWNTIKENPIPYIILLFILTLSSFFWLPSTLAPPLEASFSNIIREQLIIANRQILIQILGGAILIAGLIIAWRRSEAHWQASQAQWHEVELGRISQNAENFSRAIEQLGNENESIKLGGIYSLESIAKGAPEYHNQILEILTALIRSEREISDPAVSPPKKEDEDPIPIYIQAIISIIGRRDIRKNEPILDLSKTNLYKADFKRGNFQLVNLEGSYLKEADFRAANLNDAIIIYANLENSNFDMATLKKAEFGKSILKSVRLTRADLTDAFLGGTDLSNANLVRSILNEAGFLNANLSSCELRHTECINTDFSGAIFNNTDLSGAKLYLDIGHQAVGLTKEQIDKAIISSQTKLPDYLV